MQVPGVESKHFCGLSFQICARVLEWEGDGCLDGASKQLEELGMENDGGMKGQIGR